MPEEVLIVAQPYLDVALLDGGADSESLDEIAETLESSVLDCKHEWIQDRSPVLDGQIQYLLLVLKHVKEDISKA